MNTIEINNKQYPAHLTMGALLRFKRTSGKDVSQIKQDDIEDVLLLMYCSTQGACSAQEVEFTMSFEQFCDNITPQTVELWNNNTAAKQEKKTMNQTQK